MDIDKRISHNIGTIVIWYGEKYLNNIKVNIKTTILDIIFCNF